MMNLKEITNYFIQLFYKTNKRYSCTRSKVGKLLSILAFKYACDGTRIFEENIYRYLDCGSAIDELKLFLDRDVYMELEYCDDVKYITMPLNNKVSIPQRYEKIDTIPFLVKKDIEDIFRTFGSYSTGKLGDLIYGMFKQREMTIDDGDMIDLNIFKFLSLDDFQEKNELILYLFQK